MDESIYDDESLFFDIPVIKKNVGSKIPTRSFAYPECAF